MPHPGPDATAKYVPTPAQIKRKAAQLRKKWTKKQRKAAGERTEHAKTTAVSFDRRLNREAYR